MKIAYLTGDIVHNGHFAFYHDLISSYYRDPDWMHRIYLINPAWVPKLVPVLKENLADVRSIFPEFQRSMDQFWAKMREELEQVDVVISGNINNLDYIVPEDLKTPVVSLSLFEGGYKDASGNYGSNYKNRFHLAAISEAAKSSFPEHHRERADVIRGGISTARLKLKSIPAEMRARWFPGRSDKVKIALHFGTHQDIQGLIKAVEMLDHLPKEWHLIAITHQKSIKEIPEHLNHRVFLCEQTYHHADIIKAADVVIHPTEREGFSTCLLESWYLETPVVTTLHSSMKELIALHPDVDFGQIVPVESTPKELAEAVLRAEPSKEANECVCRNYLSTHLIDRWRSYLEKIVGG